MPRVIASNADPVDFCLTCFPNEQLARRRFGVVAVGPGPDGRGDCFEYNADHPSYEGEGYTCDGCRKRLVESDDDAFLI